MSSPAPLRETAGTVGRSLARALQRVTASPLGAYQSAVVRIGVSVTCLLFLLREWPHRHELYGPDGPWSWGMARRLISNNDAFTALMWSDSTIWFETVYVLTLVSAALLTVGWRTRATSVLFMAGVLSLQNRSIFMGDGGDNVIHLMALYLVLTRCARVWSLDARRQADEAARPTGDGRPARDVTGVVLWAVLGCVLVPASFLGDSAAPGGCRPCCGCCGWGTVHGGRSAATHLAMSCAHCSMCWPTSPTMRLFW